MELFGSSSRRLVASCRDRNVSTKFRPTPTWCRNGVESGELNERRDGKGWISRGEEEKWDGGTRDSRTPEQQRDTLRGGEDAACMSPTKIPCTHVCVLVRLLRPPAPLSSLPSLTSATCSRGWPQVRPLRRSRQPAQEATGCPASAGMGARSATLSVPASGSGVVSVCRRRWRRGTLCAFELGTSSAACRLTCWRDFCAR